MVHPSPSIAPRNQALWHSSNYKSRTLPPSHPLLAPQINISHARPLKNTAPHPLPYPQLYCRRLTSLNPHTGGACPHCTPTPARTMLRLWMALGCFVAGVWSRPKAQDIGRGVDWLTRFGYLPTPDPMTAQQQTREALTDAIRTMQRFAGLKETGILDDATIQMMQRPRCSLPDIIGTSELMRRRKRYALSGTVWTKNHLTWRVRSFPQSASLPEDTIRVLMHYALNVWSSSSRITFAQTAAENSDILIDFSKSYHEDGYPFDGPGGTLAHAFFPGEHPISGDTHFDDDETWTYNSAEGQGTDLFAVAVHEFGHALGLAHSSAEESIMKPYYQGPVGDITKYRLPPDDIFGIEQLYGKKQPDPKREDPVIPMPTQPRIPHTPPQRATLHPRHNPNRPDRCKTHFDAIANIRGEIFFFKKTFFWRIQPLGNLVSMNAAHIDLFWHGLPTTLNRVDAVYERANDSKIVFFIGTNYWVFKDTQVEPGYPRPVTDFGLPLAPIDAAFIWRHNGKTYFFKGSEFWRFDEQTGRMDPGYPRQVNLWKGIPPNIDDIVSRNNGDTYFFKGSRYWKFVNGNVESESGFPRSVARDLLYCDGPTETPDVPLATNPTHSERKECTCIYSSATPAPLTTFSLALTAAMLFTYRTLSADSLW